MLNINGLTKQEQRARAKEFMNKKGKKKSVDITFDSRPTSKTKLSKKAQRDYAAAYMISKGKTSRVPKLVQGCNKQKLSQQRQRDLAASYMAKGKNTNRASPPVTTAVSSLSITSEKKSLKQEVVHTHVQSKKTPVQRFFFPDSDSSAESEDFDDDTFETTFEEGFSKLTLEESGHS